MGTPAKLLFVCTHNLSRSHTAQMMLLAQTAYEVRSAGTSVHAPVPLSAELVAWADRLFVMEEHHAEHVRARFAAVLGGRPLICLNIPDDFQPLAPDLVAILRRRLAEHIALPEQGTK
jgi:predicted protein tyrosine phosphatase